MVANIGFLNGCIYAIAQKKAIYKLNQTLLNYKLFILNKKLIANSPWQYVYPIIKSEFLTIIVAKLPILDIQPL